MGYSRLFISVKLNDLDNTFIINLAADSSLSELVNKINTNILPQFHRGHETSVFTFQSQECTDTISGSTAQNCNIAPICVYDCTLNPPTDVTPQVIRYNQLSGPNSITLQSLNWFPSARLVIFKANDEETKDSVLKSNIHADEDFQYNLPTNASISAHAVNDGTKNVGKSTLIGTRTTKAEKMLPSQIFQTVENRFKDTHPSTSFIENSQSKRHAKATIRRTEEERRAQIDARLKKLDETISRGKKQSKSSIQVKKMLIKSRAQGDKKIRAEDRFFLEVVTMDGTISIPSRDDNPNAQISRKSESTYRFYSTASNVGKIIASSTKDLNLGNNEIAELLISVKDDGSGKQGDVYKRLPNTMPIYEVQKRGYASCFDRVIVRIFAFGHDSEDNSTPLIEDSKSTTQDSSTHNAPNVKLPNAQRDSTGGTARQNEEGRTVILGHEEDHLHKKIHEVIRELDSKDKSRRKKKTVASEKVRHILLRGKAKGNKNILEKDRFYVEILHIDSKTFILSSKPVYISKYDPIEVAAKNACRDNATFDILVESEQVGLLFKALSKEIRCIDAEREGLIKSFQRIIVKE